MNNNIIVIGFVIFLILYCVLWNKYIMHKLRQMKKLYNMVRDFQYGYYINSISQLPLSGNGNDGNSDYEVCKAIEKIDMPDDVRIKLNE